ncbi:hypothetical protein AB1N83_008732 [Pleurotus pulmonarius]
MSKCVIPTLHREWFLDFTITGIGASLDLGLVCLPTTTMLHSLTIFDSAYRMKCIVLHLHPAPFTHGLPLFLITDSSALSRVCNLLCSLTIFGSSSQANVHHPATSASPVHSPSVAMPYCRMKCVVSPLHTAAFTRRLPLCVLTASSVLSHLSILLYSLTIFRCSLLQLDVCRPASLSCSIHSPSSVVPSYRMCVVPPLNPAPLTHRLLLCTRLGGALSRLFSVLGSLTVFRPFRSQQRVCCLTSLSCSIHSPSSVVPSYSFLWVVAPIYLGLFTDCLRSFPLTACGSSRVPTLLRSLTVFRPSLSQEVRCPASSACSVHPPSSVVPSYRIECVVPPLYPDLFTHRLPWFPLTARGALSRLFSVLGPLTVLPGAFLQLVGRRARLSRSVHSLSSVLPSYSLWVVPRPHTAPFTNRLRSFPLTATSALCGLCILLYSLTVFGPSRSQRDVRRRASPSCSAHSPSYVVPSYSLWVVAPVYPSLFTNRLRSFPLTASLSSRDPVLLRSLTVFRSSLSQRVRRLASSACFVRSPSYVVPSHSKMYDVLPPHPALFTDCLRSFPHTARSVLFGLSTLLRSLTVFGPSPSQQQVCRPAIPSCSAHSPSSVLPSRSGGVHVVPL